MAFKKILFSASFIAVLLSLAACGSMPGWMQDPPKDTDKFLFTTAVETSKDLQFAIEKAEGSARTAMAQKLQTTVDATISQFKKETGSPDNAEFLEQASKVSKSITSTTVSGLRTKERKILEEDGGVKRVYVLMELSRADVNKVLLEQIKLNERLRTEFESSKGYQQLKSDADSVKK